MHIAVIDSVYSSSTAVVQQYTTFGWSYGVSVPGGIRDMVVVGYVCVSVCLLRDILLYVEAEDGKCNSYLKNNY